MAANASDQQRPTGAAALGGAALPPGSWRIPLSATLIAALYVLVWCLTVFGPWTETEFARYVRIGGRVPLLILGLALAARAYFRHDAESRWRRVWLLITAAFAAITLGELYFGAYTFASGDRPPTPSPADFCFLIYFPLLLSALLMVPRVYRGPTDLTKFALDALIVAIGGGMVIWQLGLRPTLLDASGASRIDLALALAYPLGDLLTLLGMAMVMLRLPSGAHRPTYVLLALTLGCSLLGDLVYASGTMLNAQDAGATSQFLWLLQAALFVLMANQELHRAPGADANEAAQPWQPTFALLPYIALFSGYGLVFWIARDRDFLELRSVLLLASALTVLVVARQFVAQRENVALLAEHLRRKGEARFAAMVENAADAIIVLDSAERVIYASPSAGRLMQIRAELLVGGGLNEMLHPEDRQAFSDYLAACREATRRGPTAVLRFAAGTNHWLFAETTFANLLEHAEVRGVVLNLRDVSERHALAEQLRFQALHDPLTTLANRVLFLDRADGACRRAEQGGAEVALAIVDLDQFKLVTESLGHALGDQLIVAAADRLRKAVASPEAAARLGGDEFAVLIEGWKEPDAVLVAAERVRAAFVEPFALDGQSVRITVSLGIAIVRKNERAEEALRNADIALYRAKALGRNRYELFQPELYAQVSERLALKASLPDLLAKDAFRPVFQPVVKTSDGAPAALEAQIAWREPSLAKAPIESVLAVAEEADLALDIGRWMLGALRRDLSALFRYQPESARLPLLLRMSLRQAQDPQLPEALSAFLHGLDLAPRNLLIELTETDLSESTEATQRALAAFKAQGIGLALGEFGAGRTALSMLDEFRFDALKIAANLLPEDGAATGRAHAFNGVIALTQALGIRAIASGVDSAEQAVAIKASACEWAQGDALAAPMPYERLLPWLGARFAEAAAS